MSQNENDETRIVTVEEERTTAMRLYGGDGDIAAFGYAVKKVAPWAKNMEDHDIGLVVRRALAMGVDPLNPHEVQIWTDNKKRVQFQLAYTLMAEWVRHFYGQHTEPKFDELDENGKDREGLPHSAMAFRVTFIMHSDLAKLETLLKIFQPQEARQMVTVKGLGVAFPQELQSPYFAPAGRSPAWKVQKRALVDAYRRKFGTPTRDQITVLRRISGRDQVAPEDWVEVASFAGTMTQDERTEHAIAQAETRIANEERGKMTPEKAAEILEHGRIVLHGGDNMDWDAPQEKPAETESPQDVIYEPDNFHTVAIPAILDLVDGNSHHAAGIVKIYIDQQHPLRVGDFYDWAVYYTAAREDGKAQAEAIEEATHEYLEAVPFDNAGVNND
jgi:hypothetical protein